MKPFRLCLLAALSLARVGSAADDSHSSRLDRSNLLTYPEAAGREQPVKSVADWQKRRASILRGMEEIMGLLPGAEKRCPLDMQLVEEVDGGDYVRRLVTYQSEPGSRVPAYLLIPKAALGNPLRPAPGVLCLHPTNQAFGHQVVVGLSPEVNRSYALELAQLGFVTIAPAYPHLAAYHPDLAALGYQSGTMKAIWDNRRALDLLESLPFVAHAQGFGAIGHSLGGHNAIFTAVFDPRIKVVVSSCGFDSFLDYYAGKPQVWHPGQGWTQERYMPRLAAYAGRLAEIPFDFQELLAALAPRRVLVSAPLHDANFQWQSVDRVAAAAEQIFTLYGVPDHLRVVHPDCPHDFPPEIREQAYQLLRETLLWRKP